MASSTHSSSNSPLSNTTTKPTIRQRFLQVHHIDEASNPQAQTRYISMLLQLDAISSLYNILASASTWLLLAGFVVLPGTFTTLKNSHAPASTEAGRAALGIIQNTPLLWLGAICFITAALGMSWVWWKLQENYIWLINRIFLLVSLSRS
jgi:hypothetical protein